MLNRLKYCKVILNQFPEINLFEINNMHTQGGSGTARAHIYVCALANAKGAYTSIMTCTCGSVVTTCHLARHSTINAFMYTASYRNKNLSKLVKLSRSRPEQQ